MQREQRPTMIQILGTLARSTGHPPAVQIKYLAGLAGDELRDFKAGWPVLTEERRRAVTVAASEIAEDNVDLDFSTLFQFCLSDADAAVRAAAINALTEDQDFRTADRLAVLLRQDPIVDVRVAAALGLNHFAVLAELGKLNRSSAERVRQALEASIADATESIEVRRRAIEALAVISEANVTPIIHTAYADADPKMRVSAVYAMGRNGDPSWLDTLLQEFESLDPEMRFEAAQASGEIGDERAAEPLIELLDDPDHEVQLAAIMALGQVGGVTARRALKRRASSKQASIAAAAQDALDELDTLADPLGFRTEIDPRSLN